jgi:hypothetical protein
MTVNDNPAQTHDLEDWFDMTALELREICAQIPLISRERAWGGVQGDF